MYTQPVVNNFYIKGTGSFPVPLVLTPNIPVEGLNHVGSSQATMTSKRAEPGLQTQLPTVQPARGMAKRDRNTIGYDRPLELYKAENGAWNIAREYGSQHFASRGGAVVNPYDECHQGPVRPISNEEERALLGDSIESCRRLKFARKEPLVQNDVCASNTPGGTSVQNELKRMREQYDMLNRVVEETRTELQRSREESDRFRETVNRSIMELKSEVAQLTKHIQILEGRNSSLEQSVGSLKSIERSTEAALADISTLRKEVAQNSTAVAVLEKSLECMKSQMVPTTVGSWLPGTSTAESVTKTNGAFGGVSAPFNPPTPSTTSAPQASSPENAAATKPFTFGKAPEATSTNCGFTFGNPPSGPGTVKSENSNALGSAPAPSVLPTATAVGQPSFSFGAVPNASVTNKSTTPDKMDSAGMNPFAAADVKPISFATGSSSMASGNSSSPFGAPQATFNLFGTSSTTNNGDNKNSVPPAPAGPFGAPASGLPSAFPMGAGVPPLSVPPPQGGESLIGSTQRKKIPRKY
ncbi:hypothetical protein TRVL_04894 [Trypanosoma vivax]|nr:hypothetical protein TRVL_04894 [Trypanosoma vivax]